MPRHPAQLIRSRRRALTRVASRLPINARLILGYDYRIKFRQPNENVPVIDANQAGTQQPGMPETLFANQ